MNSDLNIREPDGGYYAVERDRRDYDWHSVSGSGVYCSREHKLYDPPKGLSTGDDCPICGYELL